MSSSFPTFDEPTPPAIPVGITLSTPTTVTINFHPETPPDIIKQTHDLLIKVNATRNLDRTWTVTIRKEHIEDLRTITRLNHLPVTEEAIHALKTAWTIHDPVPQQKHERTNGTVSFTPRGQILVKAAPTKPLVNDLTRLTGLRWNDHMAGWLAPQSRLTDIALISEHHGLLLEHEVEQALHDRTRPFTYNGTLEGLREIPITALACVDAKKAERFANFGVENVFDVLMLIPRRYIDRSLPTHIQDLTPGTEAAFIGTIDQINVDTHRRMVRFNITDGTGKISLTYFNAIWQAKRFRTGDQVIISGKVDEWVGETRRALQMANPMMDPLTQDTLPIIPIYPQSEKSQVTTWDIHQAVKETLSRVGTLIDPLPDFIKERYQFMPRHEAIRIMHNPDSIDQTEHARTRLAFDELLCLQSALLLSKYGVESEQGIQHSLNHGMTEQFINNLPWPLTNAQDRVWWEIKNGLTAPHPMHRLLQGDVGSGKAQPLDSLVLTPKGFKRMGDIKIGDEVVNPTGAITHVTGVFPQGSRQIYRVIFSDDTYVRADGEHLWEVRTTTMRSRLLDAKIMTTNEIKADIAEKNGASKWHIETPFPIDLGNVDDKRPLDPYLLGVILGDGCIKYGNSTVTTGDEEMIRLIEASLPDGILLTIRRQKRNPNVFSVSLVASRRAPVPCAIDRKDEKLIVSLYEDGYSLNQIAAAADCSRIPIEKILHRQHIVMRPRAGTPNSVLEALRKMKLAGCGSHDKFIPAEYLHASVESRHALLQGLLDTDGTLDYRNGTNVSFSSVSTELAEGVAWLVRSLGGTARIMRRNRKSGESSYVSLFLPEEFPPFRLTRKNMHLRVRSTYLHPSRTITDILPDTIEEAQCISVAHPNQLYVTDNFTVTHNTYCAILTILAAVESDHQAALMAPTEILATQLYNEIVERTEGILTPYGEPVKVVLVTNKLRGKARQAVLDGLAEGSINIAVGTHALIVGDVNFKSLSVVVVDEQHRFGVEQRAALRAKGPNGIRPDMLVMTATPIPRTAAMTVFGDLDVSVIDELPPGRTPIKTSWIDTAPDLDGMFGEPWETIRSEVAKGHQAYVVCPLVEESEKMQAANATETCESLREGALYGLRLGLVHGQQKADERGEIMAQFKNGELDVLVATTVIEVGVNVPNATVIAILDCGRFGIAQLHQLRGRVGRGRAVSECVLVGRCVSQDARSRMEALCASTDGFYLSEVDLELRGHGSLFGTQQSGVSDLKVADLTLDKKLLDVARRSAEEALALDPNYANSPALKREIVAMLGDSAEAWLGKS